MAMTMKGEVRLPRPEVVWAALNDAFPVLKACIPGCDSLERPTTTRSPPRPREGRPGRRLAFKGRSTPARSRSAQRLPHRPAGRGGVAGSPRAARPSKLEPSGAGTKLLYDVEAQVGGKLASSARA